MIKLTQIRLEHALQKKLGDNWNVFVVRNRIIACTNIDPVHALAIVYSTRKDKINGIVAHEEKNGVSRSPLGEGNGWKAVIDAEYGINNGAENNLPENGKQAAATIRSEFHRIGWAYWKNALHLS